MYKSILFLALFSFLASCKSTVNPNEWVVSTGTCWNTMSVTKAGSPIPRLLTACDRLVILPATEMSAEFETETKFQARVAGSIKIAYQWRIADPILFIQSAKSITSSSTDGDHKVDPNVLESIENSVVDKILIDIIREYTPNKPAGTDELQIEQDLQKLVQSQITQRGVEFSNMSCNVNFSEQTETALDVISALKFYEVNGEQELGRKVIEAKAGATKVNTQISIPTTPAN